MTGSTPKYLQRNPVKSQKYFYSIYLHAITRIFHSILTRHLPMKCL